MPKKLSLFSQKKKLLFRKIFRNSISKSKLFFFHCSHCFLKNVGSNPLSHKWEFWTSYHTYFRRIFLSVLTKRKCWKQQFSFCYFTPILAGRTTLIQLHPLNGLLKMKGVFLDLVWPCPKIMSTSELRQMISTAMSTNAQNPDHVLLLMVSHLKQFCLIQCSNECSIEIGSKISWINLEKKLSAMKINTVCY